MAVQIPRFLQTKQYSAKDVRAMLLDLPIQTGVVGATDFDVSQRGVGANMSVDVAAGAAWLKGTTSARQGIYNFYNDGVVNVAINAAHATLPRIDQIIVRAYDSVDGGAGQDIGAVEYLAGTATSGATLDNRTGAAALPANSFRIADVLVGAAVTSITDANIRDRRPWAHGAYRRIERTANASAGSDYTRSTATFDWIDQTNLRPRMELSGVPIRLTLSGGAFVANAAEAAGYLEWGIGATGIVGAARAIWANNQVYRDFTFQTDYIPTAGSHQIGPQFKGNGTDAFTIGAAASRPLVLVVQEILTQNASND